MIELKIKTLGTIIIAIGLITIASTIYFFPFPGIPGSFTNPYSASKIMSTQQMLILSDFEPTETKEFYVETAKVTPQMLTVSQPIGDITTVTYKTGTQYHKSYVYRAELSPAQLSQLSYDKDVVGIWEIPEIKYMNIPMTTGIQEDYGNMQTALESTGVTQLFNMGLTGNNTIIAIIDDFPPEDVFLQYFPWQNRILHYPEETNANAQHGIMTACIASEVAPDAKLYLINYNKNPVEAFDEILSLKQKYPGYQIVSSNSYMFFGTTYFVPDDIVNRKILEVADNDIIVCFAAGNFAHPGEHNPSWTLDVGYDMRNGWFEKNEEIGYPAVFNNIISVAGCNAYNNKILSYSSIGRGVGGFDEPDISAPTHFIYLKSPWGASVGTSGSCPFLAGVCADILSDKKAETTRMVGAIHSYSKDRGKQGFDVEFGYGVIDAVELYNQYDNWTPPPQSRPDIILLSSGAGMIGVGVVFRKKEEWGLEF